MTSNQLSSSNEGDCSFSIGYQEHEQQASHKLLQHLETYVCESEIETASVVRSKRMIMKHPDIWYQSCEEGHITGSGLIIHKASKEILLMYHRKLQLWLQMGGHGEGELDPSQIALREAIEESGLTDLTFFPDSVQPTFIDVDAHLIPGRGDIVEHYHLDFRYLFYTSSPEKIQRAKAEAHDLRWYSFSEIPTLPLRQATLRLIQKAMSVLNSSQ